MVRKKIIGTCILYLVCCSNKKYQLKAITNDQDTILDSSFVDSIRSQSSYYKQ
jgi:hypothetical protein